MKNYTFLFLTITLFSCTSVEVQEFNNNELKIDENEIFLEYLENDWQKSLNQNPLFASYVGDKRSNDKICLLYTSPSPRDRSLSRMPSSA